MSNEFDNPDSVQEYHPSDANVVKSMLQIQAERLSRRIDAAVRKGNGVSFTLSRRAGNAVKKLAEIEGVSLSQMCSNIIEEYIE